MRLIDAYALLDIYERNSITDIITVCDKTIRQHLKDAPTIDAVPVVHARWQDHHCSNCLARCVTAKTPQDFVFNVETPYCPNCGARMDGEVDDNGQ